MVSLNQCWYSLWNMNESWAGGAINEDTQWQLQISIVVKRFSWND